jgi:hypothetical protein
VNYSLNTIRRGTQNLFSERADALDASKAGIYHKDELLECLAAVDALPEAVTSAPYKVELRSTDQRHDGLGRVIYYVTEACFHDPDASTATRENARLIRDAFIPSLEELTDSYATEAERAKKRQASVASMADTLKTFALPWDASRTLFDVVTAFLAEGQKLNTLLNDRADVPKGVQAQALQVRTKAMAVLNRFRKDLKKEIARNPKLPQDLEQRVFGFYDTLHEMESSGKPAGTTTGSTP